MPARGIYDDADDDDADDARPLWSPSPLPAHRADRTLPAVAPGAYDYADYNGGLPRPQQPPPPHSGSSAQLLQALPAQYQRAVFAQYDRLNAVQSACFADAYQSDRDLVVSAPTGAGKTGVMELCICRALEQKQQRQKVRILYVAPTKALCTERQKDWQAKFSRLGLTCHLFTGDSGDEQAYANSNHSATMRQLFNTDLIVSTPEKWDSITRRLHGDHHQLASKQRSNANAQQQLQLHIDLMIIDEVHMLNESRGATLEVVVSRMRHYLRQAGGGRHTRFVAISATVPNISDIAEWLGGSGNNQSSAVYRVFGDEFRPVPLRKVVLGFPGISQHNDGTVVNTSEGFIFDKSLNDKLLDIIHQYAEGKPALVFCPTRNSTEAAASALAQQSTGGGKQARATQQQHRNPLNLSSAQMNRLSNEAKNAADEKLRAWIPFGVAFHHAGLTLRDRNLIEKLFIDGYLRVICTTSTLACGVNLPARLVVVKSTLLYDTGQWKEQSELDVLQMMGRAGRPQFDTAGTVVIMTAQATVAKYENLVRGETNIESALHLNLIEHLNAEIVLGAVTSLDQAIRWLSSTFLAIRLLKNPAHYNIVQQTGSLSTQAQLKHLCQQAICQLSEAGAIECDASQQHIAPTEMATYMARFYLKLGTMTQVASVEADASVESILKAISAAAEFQQQNRIQNGQKPVLNHFNKAELIQYPVEGRINNIAEKVQVVIQAVLNKLPFNEHKSALTLEGESRQIVSTSLRILKCIVQRAKTEGAAILLRNAVDLSKYLGSKVWEWNDGKHRELIVRQLDKIGPVLAATLVRNGLDSIAKICDADPRRIETLCNKRMPFGNQVVEAARKIPRLSMDILQVRVLGDTQSRGYEEVSLQVSMDVLNMGSCWRQTRDQMPIYFNFLAYLSTGALVDFRRTTIQTASKQFTVKLRVYDPSATLHCCLICDSYAGIDVLKQMKPDVTEAFAAKYRNSQQSQPKFAPIQQFPSFGKFAYQPASLLGHQNAQQNPHAGKLHQQNVIEPRPITSNTKEYHPVNAQTPNPVKKLDSAAANAGAGKQDAPPVMASPKSLSSGKKRQMAIDQYMSRGANNVQLGECQHKCADKSSCGHLCCKVGKKMKRSSSLNTDKPPRKQKRAAKPADTANDVTASMFSARNMKSDFFGDRPATNQPAKSPLTNFSDMSGDEVFAQFEMSLHNLDGDDNDDEVDELAPVFRSESQELPKKKTASVRGRNEPRKSDAPPAMLSDDKYEHEPPPANMKEEAPANDETDVGTLWYSMLTSFL